MSFLDPVVQGTSGFDIFQSDRKAESFRSTIELNHDSRGELIAHRKISRYRYSVTAAFFILFAKQLRHAELHLNLCKIATSLLFYKGNEKVAIISRYIDNTPFYDVCKFNNKKKIHYFFTFFALQKIFEFSRDVSPLDGRLYLSIVC